MPTTASTFAEKGQHAMRYVAQYSSAFSANVLQLALKRTYSAYTFLWL